MARISKYTRDTDLTDKDLLVGSNYISGSLGEEIYETSTFNLGNLKTFILQGVAGGANPYTNDNVDAHLNKDNDTPNGYVLSLSNNDYTWVPSSAGGTVTSIATASPITGGPIASTGTIGIDQATTSTDGYLSSTDWNTFNTKQSTSEKGVASGYAPLDANQKVPTDNLPDSLVGAVVYKGTWNANTNTPTLPNPAAGNNGHYYIVSDAGTYSQITYAVGDWAISNGIAWEKVDNTQDVNSVFGRQGNVVADAADYSSFYDANVQSNWNEADNASDAFILNKPTTITQTQAEAIAANTLKTSFPGFGTTAGKVLEGNTVIPSAYTNANVDTHLNKSTAQANQVLSWTGNDYGWVTQSSGSSFSGSYNDLTDTPTLFSGSYNDLTDQPTIPAGYTDADVDTHLNKDAQTQDGYVLSLSNNDYTWVEQSGGISGTASSDTSTTAITEIKTITQTEYDDITNPDSDIMYVII